MHEIKIRGEYLVCSSYWSSWSRCIYYPGSPRAALMPENRLGWYVEVNLTPIPCCVSSNWEKDVKPILIRLHGTPRKFAPGHQADRVGPLPLEIIVQMREQLGNGLFHRLLNEDFLSQIDWDKYNSAPSQTKGGGIPLVECLKHDVAAS